MRSLPSFAMMFHAYYNADRRSRLSRLSTEIIRPLSGLTMAMSDIRTMRTFSRACFVLLVFRGGAGLAGAHVALIESSLKDKGTLAVSAPETFVLRFDAKIKKSLASVSVESADGRSLPLPRLIEGDTPDTSDRLCNAFTRPRTRYPSPALYGIFNRRL